MLELRRGDLPMVYQAHMQNGTVIIDDPANIAEGAKLEVRVISQPVEQPHAPPAERPWLKHLGCVKDFPPDASQTIDEVLYGQPNE